MTPDEAVAHVTRLLEAYPGVKVDVAVHHSEVRNSYFRLIVTSISSLARLLNHSSAGANLRTKVRSRPCSFRAGQTYDDCVQLAFDAPDDGDDSFAEPPAQPLQILGIFLARDLKHLKLIPADEADRLQKAFHGEVV